MTQAGFFGRNIVARGLTSLGTALLLLAAMAPSAFAQAQHVRWDIISIIFGPPNPVSAGGHASALANDNSKITVTGTGTFVAPAGGGGTSSAATGGGMWTVCNAAGTGCTSGTYEVTGLARWEQAPGTPSPANIDLIDDGETSAGLAVLRVLGFRRHHCVERPRRLLEPRGARGWGQCRPYGLSRSVGVTYRRTR